MATVLNGFIENINNKYGVSENIGNVRNFFKEHVNVGSAIVNILGSTGIAGFKFHLPQKERIRLENLITDHYTEINTPIQDHVADKPIEITLEGLQGEYFYSVNQIEDMLAKVIPTMTLVKTFLPKLRAITMQIKSLKKETEYRINPETGVLEAGIVASRNQFNGVDLFKLFQDIYKLKSAQTRAYFFFEALKQSRALFSVETSWRRFDNMIIKYIDVLRDNNADITNFSVVVKQMSFAESKSESIEQYAGRRKLQMSETINKGVDKGKEVSTI